MIALSGYKGERMDIQELDGKIQRLEALIKERAALRKQLKSLDDIASGIEAELIMLMVERGVNSLGGVDHYFVLDRSVEPELVDWGALSNYIREYDALDLLQKRLTVSAVKLRWADNIVIPGVDKYEKLKLKSKEL